MSIMEGIGQFGLSFANAMMKRDAEQKAAAKAAEKEAYERKRQDWADKLTQEKHDLEKKSTEQQIAANDIKIKDDTETYQQNHDQRYWLKGYSAAKSLYDTGDTDGMLAAVAQTTNGDANLGYTVDYQKDENGQIAYHTDEKTGQQYVTMIATDKKTGKTRPIVATPDKILSANALMTNPQAYAKSEMDYQDWARKQNDEYSIWKTKANDDYDIWSKKTKDEYGVWKDKADYEDRIGDENASRDYNYRINEYGARDAIDDGNAARDHGYRMKEASFNSGLQKDEMGYRYGLENQQWVIQGGRLELAVKGEKLKQEKIQTAQLQSGLANGLPGMTEKERKAYAKKMESFPVTLSKTMNTKTNQVAGTMVKELGVDSGKARLAVGDFNKYMLLAVNAKDAQSYSQNFNAAFNALAAGVPREKFKTDQEHIKYLEMLTGQLTGYGSGTDFGYALGGYIKYKGRAGIEKPVAQPQKPQLTLPTRAPQAKQPVNNNTPYNGVAANTQSTVPGANQKLAQDVLK